MDNSFSSNPNSPSTAGLTTDRATPREPRVMLFAVAVAACLFFSFTAEVRGVPGFFNYLAIFFGLVPVTLHLLFKPSQARIGVVELIIFAILVVLVPVAFFNNQSPTDVFGNFLRYLFLILAVSFWRANIVDLDDMLDDLYSILWKVVLFAVVYMVALRTVGLISGSAQHVPAIIFLFAYALRKGKFSHVALLVVLALVSGKESLYISIATMIGIELLYRRVWWAGALMLVFGLMFFGLGTNPVFYVLDLMGGNFQRVGVFLSFGGVPNAWAVWGVYPVAVLYPPDVPHQQAVEHSVCRPVWGAVICVAVKHSVYGPDPDFAERFAVCLGGGPDKTKR